MAFPEINYDGDFSYPRTVEGGPIIAMDPITLSLIIQRKYVVLSKNYLPLMQGSTVKDPRFTDAYYIDEGVDSVQGPLTFFTRRFAQLPQSRVEPQEITWTIPGQASWDTSLITSAVIAWNKYGKGAPYSRVVMASAHISYLFNPAVDPIVISKVTFNGVPVDYTGFVYRFVGNVEVPQPGGTSITEPRWFPDGVTAPGFVSGPWTVSGAFTRWMGPIWERRVIIVDANQLY